MLQSHEEKPSSTKPIDLTNRIIQLLEYQHYAVRRAASIGMSHEEAADMDARINEIRELIEQLRSRLTSK